jgi:Flp pilus assembly protein TadD
MTFDNTHDQILDHLQHRRFGQAQYHLRRLVKEEPADAPTRSLLALCLAELEQFEEATQQGRRAVQLAPNEPYCRWALAVILASRRFYKEGLIEASAAIELDPDNADYHALTARCYVGLGKWTEALSAADAGLVVDPDHEGCANLRALALQQAGRTSDADQAFIDAAALDPDNAFARAGRGWVALSHGSAPDDALPHFYSALQLDPGSEWARTGLMTALKARNPVYRLMLRYFLWMESLPPRTRMIIVVAGMFFYGRLRGLAKANPSLGPVIYPLLGLYLLFILLSWTADPLFNFLLRFDPVGRKMIGADERRASTAVVSLLCITIVAAIAGIVMHSDRALLFALISGIMVIPVAGMFQCERGWPRTTMAIYSAVVATAGIAGVLTTGDAAGVLIGISLLGAILGSWLAAWLTTKSVTR